MILKKILRPVCLFIPFIFGKSLASDKSCETKLINDYPSSLMGVNLDTPEDRESDLKHLGNTFTDMTVEHSEAYLENNRVDLIFRLVCDAPVWEKFRENCQAMKHAGLKIDKKRYNVSFVPGKLPYCKGQSLRFHTVSVDDALRYYRDWHFFVRGDDLVMRDH